MAEAAAANGIPKKVIPADVCQFTADSVQTPVRSILNLRASLFVTNILYRTTSIWNFNQNLTLLSPSQRVKFFNR